MSCPLSATPHQLRRIADFLDGLTKLTADTGVQLCVYGRTELAHADITVSFSRTEADTYVLDDTIGA